MKMEEDNSKSGEIPTTQDFQVPPPIVFVELGIENQSDCAIRSIYASKPHGLNLELRPIAERWEQTTDGPSVLRRIPAKFGPLDPPSPTSRSGFCSTCFEPCARCQLRRSRNKRLPPKRYLSCAYVDLPSHEMFRIGIEIPTTNSDQTGGQDKDELISLAGDDNHTSDVSTQTDGLPGRISNIYVDQDADTPVELTLQIDKELDPPRWLESPLGASTINGAGDEAQKGRDEKDRSGSSSSSDDPDGRRTRSSTITPLDQEQDGPMLDSNQNRNQTPEMLTEDLLVESIPTTETQPDFLDLEQGEADHLERMRAVFGDPLDPQPLPMLPEEETPSDGFQLSDGLDITPEEFEQFVALNAAFGGPSVIPPPRFAAEETHSLPTGPVQQQSMQQFDLEPPQATINLTDSLDLTQDEYEQFLAMNAAFGGPSVIPPPRMILKEEAQPQQANTPATRPQSLNLQPVAEAEGDRTPSPRSPGLARQSAVRLTESAASSMDDNSRQSSVEGRTFWDDLNETAVRNTNHLELDSCQQKEDSAQEYEASLVASSQEDEGSLTPIFENLPLTFDTGAVGNSETHSVTPTNEQNRIPKGPVFVEELVISSGDAHGENAVLMRCEIDAWPPAKVSWFYKDEPLGDGDQAVDPDRVLLKSDEARGVYSLLLREVESFDTGIYTCKASNDTGEATSAAELIVQESVSDSEYETARSYFTSGDEIVDNFSESWLARGRGGSAMSPGRTVRITTHGASAPHFTFKPQSRVVEIGQTARLICGVKGSPKPRVSWFSHGMELKSEGRYRVFESDEPGNFVLEIREVEPSDAGHYTCTAGNIIGQVYCSTELSVEEFGEPEVDVKFAAEEMSSLPIQYLQYGPDTPSEEQVEPPPAVEEARPVIPQKLFATEGETTRLQCSVMGHETSDVIWRKDGETLTPSEHYAISVDGDNFLLTIPKTGLKDEGEYTCSLAYPPHTLLSSCLLVVQETESSTDDRNAPPSSTPIPSALQTNNRSSTGEDETRHSSLNQTPIVHTDSLEVINPPWFSPIEDSRKARHRGLNGIGFSDTNSSHGSVEGAAVKWREKPPQPAPRKHRESWKSRKNSQHHSYMRYDSSESDSSSDSPNRSRRKSATHRSKSHRKSRNSVSSDLDEEFDTGLERIMALSDKADTCLNIVNSVLEMTSLDKEVDEALQEQISALRPDISESDDSVRPAENRGDILVDSDTDVDFIKQMAAQKVAGAIAEQMMREASSLPIEPSHSDDLPLANGFSTANLVTEESSDVEVHRTSDEVTPDLAQDVSDDSPPISYTTSAEVQEASPIVENGSDKPDLKLSLDIHVDVPTETGQPSSPRTCLFRGPEDKIFTLDEIIDALPETAVDENPSASQSPPSPEDKAQKFTLLGCYSQSQTPNSVEDSTPTGSPRQESPLEGPLPEDSPPEDSPPKLLTQLQDTFVLEGDAMRLEVQISGFPVPDVTWHRDDMELHPGKNLQLRFDGEDTWAVIIRNIKAREGGVYTCTATNKLGSVSTSAAIGVAGLVDGPDAPDGSEEDGTVEEENPRSPVASESSPTADDEVFMRETKRGDILPRILLNAEETNIDSVTSGQSRQENLQELSTRVGDALSLDRNANWADESSPDISRSNSNNSDKGASYRLPKRNRPDSNIEIRHRKAFRKHPSRDSVTSVEPCSTGNSASESETEGAPKFIKPLETTEILEGESVQFEVCVTGEPEPRVRWFHDGSELKASSRIKCCRLEDSPDSSCYTWQLSISNVRPKDDGKYICKAENEVGAKSCFAFLIVEALNANDGSPDEADKKIVSRLLKEREDDQSIGESSQIEEDLLKIFTVESDYSDSSGRMTVKKGDQVELLDGRNKDKWLVRHKTNANMIGYIPCTLLRKNPSSSSDRDDKKIIYNFISKQSSERRNSNNMKQRPRVNRHLSLKDGQLSELDEDRIIEDFSDAEPPQCYDLFVAVASYTPSPEQEGFIAMRENQVFEVLDCNSATNWIVRGQSSPHLEGWVPASYLVPYTSSGHNSTRRESRSIGEDTEEAGTEEGEEGAGESGSKKKEAMLKRGYVLKELLDTERDYVKDLKYVTTRFIPPIEHPNVPFFLKGKKDDIFCNIKEIYAFHNKKFLHELEECENDANSIGRAFIKWQSTFIDLHVMYCKNKPKADAVLTPAAKAFFLQYGGGTGPGQLGLGDYLIKPVQRITKYQLLLKEIIKYTSRAKEDCQELEFALNVMIEVPKRANDLMYLNLIEGFQRDVTELGKLYRQDSFSAWSGKPKGRGKERHLFLFKDVLLFTKPKKEMKGDVVGYIYKSHSMVGTLNVSEDQTDERRFEISQGRSAPLTLLAKTKYVKEAWVKSLRDLIAEIPKDLREGKSASERRFDHSPLIMRKRRALSMLSPGSSMTSLLAEPALMGNLSKSTESLTTLLSSPTLLSVPRSGRGSLDSMASSGDYTVFSALVPAIGATYEVKEDLVADGHETIELLKGDAVKLLDVCENNLFHIQTLPADESSPGIEGYVPPGLLKKMGAEEEPPTFTERAKSCLVSADESATFTCMFTGKPAPTASWSLPGHLSPDSKRLEILNSEEVSKLTLYGVTAQDSGEYTCTVENSSGSVSCTAKLDVKGTLSSKGAPLDLCLDNVREIPLARSSSPLPTSPVPEEALSMVRSTSLENLKTMDEDFDVFPGEIVRSSSVSGRGALNSSKKSYSMDKIGSFRKHFKKALSNVGMDKDKFLHNFQRAPSGSSLQRGKYQQKQGSATCIYCRAARDEVGEDGHTVHVCEACAQKTLTGSQETLMEEEEDPSAR